MERLTERLAPTDGHLHGDGHRQHHGVHRRSVGHRASRQCVHPATHADRIRCAEATGRTATGMAQRETGAKTAADFLTPTAFRNALAVLQAIGGSTNALVHLAAIAGRRGIAIDLDAFDQIGRTVPVLVDLKPAGQALHGALSSRGRHAAPDAGNRAASRPVRADRQRRDARRLRGRCRRCSRAGRDPLACGSAEVRRQHGGVARQSGAARRGDQAFRRDASAAATRRPRRGLRGCRGL